MNNIILIIIAIVLVILLFLYLKIRKLPKFGSLVLINGGVKTGKTTFCVYSAYRKYRSNLLKWRFKCFFIKLFKRLHFKKFINMELPERPLFYSNIPVKFPYVPVTTAILKREERVSYKSVIFLDEASLIANSMSFGDKLTDEQLLLFCKLIGHETHGGSLFVNTQSISDLHYAFKRCIDSYFYVHHTTKIFPFFLIMYVRELKYSYDDNSVNVFNSDVEDTLKICVVPKKIWKKFDQYAFSVFTDDLKYPNNERIAVDMKVDEFASFIKFKSLRLDKHEKS